MKHISILVPFESVPASIVDPRYMFTAANEFLKQAGKEPLFDVHLVGLTRDVSLNGGAFSVHADSTIHDVKKTDVIFVPALSGDLVNALELNKEFVP